MHSIYGSVSQKDWFHLKNIIVILNAFAHLKKDLRLYFIAWYNTVFIFLLFIIHVNVIICGWVGYAWIYKLLITVKPTTWYKGET